MEDRIDSEGAPAASAPDIGLGRIGRAFGYSCEGLSCAWRTEAAFRQEALAAIVLVPLACLLPLPLVHRAMLVASVLLVMIVELINSSVEAAIDRISLDHHPLSKRAKDTGSAAVMLAIMVALITWTAAIAGWLLS